MTFLASIPSPSSGTVDLGPFQIHMYGLTLLAAIAVCIWITGHRYVNRGGDWDLIFRCAVWGVGAGIVGARLYHLATSWNEVPDTVVGAVRDLEGRARRLGRDRPRVPRRRLHREARGSGRLAPRGLPRPGAARGTGDRPDRQLVESGALRQGHRPAVGARDRPGSPAATVFGALEPDLPSDVPLRAPLGPFAAALLVFIVERRFRPRPPGLFALYIALYSFGRFWIELVRVDPANHILGYRVNTWVSGLVCIAGVVWFVLSQRRREGTSGSHAPRASRGASRRRPSPGPKMSVPKGRVRPGG